MPTNVTRGMTLTNTGSQFQSRTCCRTRLRWPSRTWNLSRLSLPSGIGDVTHAPSIAPIERAKCCAVCCRSFGIAVMSPLLRHAVFATSIEVRHGFSRFLSILTKASHPVTFVIVGPVRPPLILGKLRGAHVSRLHVDLQRPAIPFVGFASAPLFCLLNLQARH